MPEEVNIKVYIPTLGYFIWNKNLEFGEGTHNEDLWLSGYEFWAFSLFGRTLLDYGYEYPIKALRFKEFEIYVREMRDDEKLDDGLKWWCDIDGTIYFEGEEDFELIAPTKTDKQTEV